MTSHPTIGECIFSVISGSIIGALISLGMGWTWPMSGLPGAIFIFLIMSLFLDYESDSKPQA